MTESTSERLIKRLLFICVENSNRSQMAEAFARIHGGEQIEAYSAGSRPSGTINPKAIESMKEIGYDLSQHQSKSLSEIPNIEFDFVATMGCGDQKICSPWREPWGQERQCKPAPAGAKPFVDIVSSFAALRLARRPQPIPTAYAVGYRSVAAPRLWLMSLKTLT